MVRAHVLLWTCAPGALFFYLYRQNSFFEPPLVGGVGKSMHAQFWLGFRVFF